MIQSETSSSHSDSGFSEEEFDDDDLEGFSSKEDKVTSEMVVALNQLCSNTIKMLCGFQKEVLKCKQFNFQEDLNIIIELIRKNISNIYSGADIVKEKTELKGFDENLKKFQQIIFEIKEKLNLWLLEAQKKTSLKYLMMKIFQSKQLRLSTLKIGSKKMQLDKTNTLLFVSIDNKIMIYGFNNQNKKQKN